AAGTYTGRIQLLACADAQCNTRLGNTPLPVTYTVKVHPALKVTPGGTVDINVVSGNEGSQVFNVQLPDGATSFTITSLTGGNQYRIENLSSSSFRLVLRSSPSGNYNNIFKVDAGGQSTSLVVNYHVSVPPGGEHSLQASPDNFTFTATEGG